ncbi:ABC transporter ATP-binding protein [Desertimonas flava]|uniref:ABC transporter ATP-binding protein n=1 Tax=Desertimonas flava TaxID=2064846 RepID=UPI000E340DBE|nr:ABC transporter ATP-binding protein [Desertimonas flava]
MTLLETTGLTLGYHGQAVVRGLHLSVDEGEIVALLGANGAGKTTTLLGLSGLVAAMSGDVLLDGRSLASVAPDERVRRGLAHVPEDRALFADLTVLENLQLGQHSRRRSVDDALDRCPELRPLLSRRAGLLSGGEQQMLAMARALAGKPRLLLVDEMSLGLAPLIVQRLLDMLDELAHASGCAVLLVEQHVQQALAVADRGYVLNRGEIALHGTVPVLRERSAQLEATYLGESVGGH